MYVEKGKYNSRHGSGVFLVQAVTIMLAGCDCDALGPKRARRRKVVKRKEYNRLP